MGRSGRVDLGASQPSTAGDTPARTAALEQRLAAFSTLIQLGREARQAESRVELGFVMVNETHRLVPYRQGALWLRDGLGRIRIEAVTATSSPDDHSPYVAWLRGLVAGCMEHASSLAPDPSSGMDAGAWDVARDALDAENAAGWDAWCPGHVLACTFGARSGDPAGGLIFMRDTAFDARERALIEECAGIYGHAFAAYERADRSAPRRLLRAFGARRLGLLFILMLVGLGFLPVNESTLAPAAVIARNPTIVAAPVDGIVARFHVQPNAAVVPGDALFSLYDTTFRNRLTIASKALEVTRAELRQITARAFLEPEVKARFAILEAQVAEREAEVRYAEELVSRITIRAERAGLAIFADVNEWIGRPVRTGERVLALADPARVEVEAWVEVSDAVSLDPGARVRLFLDTAPTRPIDAELTRSAYEAQPTAAGPLAYRAVARFADGPDAAPRIGLEGTAKIYGKRVRLAYLVMRRPIAWLRQHLGL